ncbi:MAG: 3,4-dihydroxy-2-butanone-4-phosphate synthase [Cryomorphaceae bacterium]|nr:3,4-dihydroxy-2-butanone-4-phosphate synthase [Cryomorphaceae bacterium]
MSGNQQNESKYKLNSIEEAISDIKAGKVVIVVDDEDRENEGDFVGAAEMATPEMINFMATNGRGLICTPLPEDHCDKLGLTPMVQNNTDPHHTSFTVSIDLLGHGNTTGISAADRSRTIKALVDPKTKPEDFARPGHIFPLRAKPGGVLRRTGHTEAAIDLARLAGLNPAGVIVEIMNEDGSMARLPQLYEIAKRLDLKLISIEDLVAFRMQHESLIHLEDSFQVPTAYGEFTLFAYRQTTNQQIHLALKIGEWDKETPVAVRMHSTQVGSDLLGILENDPGIQLDKALKAVAKEGSGVIVYMNQVNPQNNLLSRLNQFKSKLQGDSTAARSLSFGKDPRDIGVGAQILHQLGVKKIKLLTNNPIKRVGVVGYGLEIIENIKM